MACYHPLQAFLIKNIKTGKNRVVFPSERRNITHYVDAIEDKSVENGSDLKLPCSACVGCKLEYSRQWSVRCIHEASYHKSNCFITLTYDNAHLPEFGTLVKKHVQDFFKRLRSRFPDYPMKYYHCGEYGDKLGRPHYHILLFGFDFSDKTYYSERRGNVYYVSELLAQIWPFGKAILGDVTLQSAGYVARYATKKQYGRFASRYYGKRIPEYATMSNGIGERWFYDNWRDVYPADDIIILNHKNKPVRHKPPRRYDELLKELDPKLYVAGGGR